MILHPNKGWVAVDDWDAKIMIETTLQRPGLLIGVPIGLGCVAEAEVPFAKTGCGVALTLQEAGDGGFFWIDHQRTRIHHWPPKVLPEWVLAREQRVP